MTEQLRDINKITAMVDDDKTATIELIKIIQGLNETVRQQAVTIADHEARITALEP